MMIMVIPAKLAFALAAGATLLYGLRGESARIAADAGGLPFDSTDPDSLADAVRRLARLQPGAGERLRRQALDYYREHFARPTLLGQYVRLFRALLP
jgi:glycosyltransferase involved in cell wall biosynthesis